MDIFSQFFPAGTAFMQRALLTGILSGIAMGITGTVVVTRRISAIAGAVAHAVLGGVGAALFCSRVLGWAWFSPMLGATAGAVTAALLIGLASLYAGEREDTVIAAVWAVGMSAGLLFLDKTPGYVDFQGYLFGNILLLPQSSIWWTLALDAAVLIPALLFYNNLLAVSFDSTFAGLRGLRVKMLYLAMLILTALTIVLMVYVAGIVLVIALLTLPAATAGCFARRLWSMMALAVLFCWIFVTSGLALSCYWDFSSGPVIVMIAAAAYCLAQLQAACRRPKA